ncbi:MAG: hypothetical protein H7Y38_00565 [Armatimonadetes bacterium]|nr:hypothetical protein [Armatimonadota bacterium]
MSPAAAKILEQYRNAGKGIPVGAEGVSPDGADAPTKPVGPPPSQPIRRSGSRGK